MRLQYLGLDEDGDMERNNDFLSKQKTKDGCDGNNGEDEVMKGKRRGEDSVEGSNK